MTIALVATGDELIHGDTLNTNSYHLAQILTSEGLPLGLQMVCSDKEQEIYDCLSFLAIDHDLIIITGGLGPTSDDRTRFVLARFLDVELIEYPKAIEHIKNRLKQTDKELNPGNKQQTLFPADSILLANPFGTAMGFFYKWKNKIFILLPGPPRECLPMFNNHVLPLLEQELRSDKQLLKWLVFGVAESEIAKRFDESLADLNCKTGYRLDLPYIECKVSCQKNLVSQVKERIEPLAAPFIIGQGTEKASKSLHALILKKKMPIVIIDKVTGGILQTLIQDPTTYSWVKFYQEPQAQFQFHLFGLQEFWTREENFGNSELTIEYQFAGKKGQESHEIPYRSPNVVYYAAEWLSFRLFHLINHLHQGKT